MAGQGIIGQLAGPFSKNQNVIPLIANKEGVTAPIFFKLGISLGEKDYMIYTKEKVTKEEQTIKVEVEKRFTFELNLGSGYEEFWLGKTQIYESDDGLNITGLRFPDGAPASTLIEYTILMRE